MKKVWLYQTFFLYLSYQKRKAMIEIKITGSGTADEIVEALRRVAKNIALNAAEHGVNMMDGSVWEDSTLLTEIKTA